MKFNRLSGNWDAASRDMEQTTERLTADANGITRAAKLLRQGQLVALPTETVYGLGADACNGQAVAEIYAAKGRPSFNPLIVHVASLKGAQAFGEFSETALGLVGEDWPEGLTLVVPLRADTGLSPLVTAGNDSVALRVPKSPLAQALLAEFDGPVAAPSANPSGRISPTTADHVLSGLDGKIAAVLDGGPTDAGLESTIISFVGNEPVVLREGVYQPPENMARHTKAEGANIQAPGQMSSHYAPLAAVRLNVTVPLEGEFHLGFGRLQGDLNLSAKGDLVEAAANLFAHLHEMDRRGITRLAVAPIPMAGLGRAINDRLARAAAPR